METGRKYMIIALLLVLSFFLARDSMGHGKDEHGEAETRIEKAPDQVMTANFSETQSAEDPYANPGKGRGRENNFSLHSLVEPLGVITFSLLTITSVIGFYRKRIPKIFIKWHKRFAIATIISASTHAILVMLIH